MSTNNTSTSIKHLPLIEVMQVMYQDVAVFKAVLKDDSSTKTVQDILEELGEYNIDERLPEDVTTFFAEMLNSNKSYTHESLSSELDILLAVLKDAIASQQHKDNVEFVRAILKVMVKHADEVASWMEEEFK